VRARRIVREPTPEPATVATTSTEPGRTPSAAPVGRDGSEVIAFTDKTLGGATETQPRAQRCVELTEPGAQQHACVRLVSVEGGASARMDMPLGDRGFELRVSVPPRSVF
jgi:hypothetical protein